MSHLGLDAGRIRVYDVVQQLPYLADSLLDRFAVDTRMVQLPPAHVAGVPILDEGDYWAIYDRWGSKMRMPKQAGLYYDWFQYPIEATLESLDGYAWPEPDPIDVVGHARGTRPSGSTSTRTTPWSGRA